MTTVLQRPSSDMMAWQYKVLVAELQLLTIHASDYTCPCSLADTSEWCLAKHLLSIYALSLETAAMTSDPAHRDLLVKLGNEANDLHMDMRMFVQSPQEAKSDVNLVTWSRDWRKRLEPLYYSANPQTVGQVTVSQPSEAAMETPPPIGWVGGKNRLKHRIIALIPPHKTYVEPFAGAASVFWAKEPAEVEVLNDIDPDLMRFYRNIGQVANCDTAKVAKDWEGLKARQGELAPCEFFTAVKCSFGSGMFKGGKAIDSRTCLSGQPHFHKNLAEYQARLANTRLHNEDWEQVVKRYDAPDTFFYLDPPFHGTGRYYRDGADQDQLERLAKVLPTLKGQWLLSYDDHPEVRAAFQNSHIRKVETRYTIAADDNTYLAKELFIANYPLSVNASQRLPLCTPAQQKRLERCILALKARGSKANPWAVCQAALECARRRWQIPADSGNWVYAPELRQQIGMGLRWGGFLRNMQRSLMHIQEELVEVKENQGVTLSNLKSIALNIGLMQRDIASVQTDVIQSNIEPWPEGWFEDEDDENGDTDMAQIAKEPWQMTQAEFVAKDLRFTKRSIGARFYAILTLDERNSITRLAERDHRIRVVVALSEGKPVPPNVLADYPELVKPAGGIVGRRATASVAPQPAMFQSQARLSQSFMDLIARTALATAVSIGVAKALSSSVIPQADKPLPTPEATTPLTTTETAEVLSPAFVEGDQATVDLGTLLQEINEILKDERKMGIVDARTLQIVRA